MSEDWRFGLVIGMDNSPDLRLLVLCEAPPELGRHWRHETWGALVLADDPTDYFAWPSGEIVTVSPEAHGVVTFGAIRSEEGV